MRTGAVKIQDTKARDSRARIDTEDAVLESLDDDAKVAAPAA